MRAPTYPIHTPRLLLRPHRLDDVDAMHAIQSRSDVARYMAWAPRSRDEVAAVVETRARQTAWQREGDSVVLVVVPRDGNAAIGNVNLNWLSAERREGEIGFMFHPAYHGHGYAAEAATEMLRTGFRELGLHRIIGCADAANEASTRLMSRLGMRQEAHFRQNELIKGVWTDNVVYAALANEWVAPDRTRTAEPG